MQIVKRVNQTEGIKHLTRFWEFPRFGSSFQFIQLLSCDEQPHSVKAASARAASFEFE